MEYKVSFLSGSLSSELAPLRFDRCMKLFINVISLSQNQPSLTLGMYSYRGNWKTTLLLSQLTLAAKSFHISISSHKSSSRRRLNRAIALYSP
jgi:hypothetical protein